MTFRLALAVSTYILFSFVQVDAVAQETVQRAEPEAATGFTEKKAFVANEYMVVAANPYASWAGRNIIEKGGSAIDAAVAVQAMLTLVEPQSSGIGGGAFILYWDNKNKVLHTYDGREKAPANVNAYWFMDGMKPMGWIDAVVGGKSVGVPGVLKALELAQGEFGSLKWEDLFDDAINTADKGFRVSKRLADLIALDYHPGLKKFPVSSTYFFPAGKPLQEGVIRRNKPLSRTLTRIATRGTDYFYKGELAKKIVKQVNSANINPGKMTVEDMAEYEAIKREPVCGLYRQHSVCGMAPPSSGGINVFQILKMLEPHDFSKIKLMSADFVHLFSQATSLAYADREQFIADTDFTNLPYAALINTAYLNRRGQEVALNKRWRQVRPGRPYANAKLGAGMSLEQPNTSHITIVDKAGNAVSMTTSIEFMFGSGLMVEGFLLNNQLTDFSFQPTKDRFAVLNRVEPHKRPRSAMSPTMVFDSSGQLRVLVGSPGGSRIISYVAQTIIGVLDYKLNIQEAINLPKVTNRNDYTALEKGAGLESLEDALNKRGHPVRFMDLNSGLHGIEFRNGTLVGGADPRREGVAVGR